MKSTLIILSIILLSLSNGIAQDSPEYYFKFEISDPSEIDTLTQIISIDNVQDLVVYAYAMPKQFEHFKQMEYKYEILQKVIPKSLSMATTVSEMNNWNRYPTYEVYRQMMKNFETNYPSICKLDSIGVTQNGRQLYVLKISDNVQAEESEPEFFYSSTMHGDETTGFIMLLRLADSLLSSYGLSEHINTLVDNIEIYINPNANPDGTYYGGNSTVSVAIRSNGYADLNRDYPDPKSGANSPYQPETEAMMNFAEGHHFVMSANFHGGAEVMNYPWDTWYYSENPHADTDWFEMICTDYVSSARTIFPNYMNDVTSDGVIHGATWYRIGGGRQDYMNYWHQCREVTIEISSTKLLAVEQLNNYWNYNKQSLLNYLNECLYGIRGEVTNSEGTPLYAQIEVIAHDQVNDSSMVFTDADHGNYHRLIQAGTFDIVASAEGYINDTLKNIDVSWQNTTWANFVLHTPDELTDSIELMVNPQEINDTLFFDRAVSHELIIWNDSTASTTNYYLDIDGSVINNWLMLSKNSGTLNEAEKDTVFVSISTDQLTAGNYSALILLQSEDNKTDTVEVHLMVKDTISTYLEPHSIVDTLWGGDLTSYKIILKNNGLHSLNYNITIENQAEKPWISLNKTSGNLAITESDTIITTIESTGIGFGNFTGKLIIEKENSTTDTIPIELFVKDTVNMEMNPLFITDTLNPDTSKGYMIYLKNSGRNTLYYSIDFNALDYTWVTVNKSEDSIHFAEEDSVAIILNTTNLSSGDYSFDMTITENDGDYYTLPLNVHINQFQSSKLGTELRYVNAYPNPFTSELIIEIVSNKPLPVFVQLITMEGLVVYQKKFPTIGNETQVLRLTHINSLSRGVYLLNISTSKEIRIRKIIKN